MSAPQSGSAPGQSREWSERSVVVTGGGSGIGCAVAVELASRGADVLIVGRRATTLTATAATAAGRGVVRTHIADITRPEEIAGIVDAALAARGRLDVLVNNAGIGLPAALGEIDGAAAHRVWATNVQAPTLLTQAALPHLAETRGNVVNVSSSFGAKPAPGLSVYGASKAALEQLTRSWALELADRGVRVNAVAPGPTESEALAAMGLNPESIEAIAAAERERIPLGRRGDPTDVASWVIALAEAETWVTGQVLGVDGGFLIA